MTSTSTSVLPCSANAPPEGRIAITGRSSSTGSRRRYDERSARQRRTNDAADAVGERRRRFAHLQVRAGGERAAQARRQPGAQLRPGAAGRKQHQQRRDALHGGVEGRRRESGRAAARPGRGPRTPAPCPRRRGRGCAAIFVVEVAIGHHDREHRHARGVRHASSLGEREQRRNGGDAVVKIDGNEQIRQRAPRGQNHACADRPVSIEHDDPRVAIMADGPDGMAPGPDGDGDDEELVDIELEEIAGEALAPPRAPPLPASAQLPARPPGSTRPPRPTEPQVPLEAPRVPASGRGRGRAGRLSSRCGSQSSRRPRRDAHADRVDARERGGGRDGAVPPRGAAARGGAARGGGGRSDERALAAAREAFAADPSLAVTLWGLRRLLSRAGHWQELADAYQTGCRRRSRSPPPGRRARRARARTCSWSGGGCSRIGCSATPTRSPATTPRSRSIRITRARCSRCCSWARGGRNRRRSRRALGGLARRAEGTRRAALAIEEARAWRQSDGACPTARRGRWACSPRSSHAAIAALPVGTVLGELDALTARGRAARCRGARARRDRGARGGRRSRAGGRAVARAGAAADRADWTRRRTRSRRSRRRRAWTRRTRSSRRIGCCSSRRWRAARRPMRWRRR